jgi:hypothetical protein
MDAFSCAAICLYLASSQATAQDQKPPGVAAPPAEQAAPVAAPQQPPPAKEPVQLAQTKPGWDISGNAYYSDPPHSEARTTAIVYADRGPLHLEARYGYEDSNTGSLWAGWNLAFGGQVQAEVTPMLGVVMGDTEGIAPGVEVNLAWKKLTWYAESEYLFDSQDSDDDFAYTWSTLTYQISKNLSAGLVAERTREVHTKYDIQRGFTATFAAKNFAVSVYAYNVDSDDFYSVVSVGYIR